MERCTIRLKTGEARCAQLDGNVVVERLAAYEDTGLEPEEVETIKLALAAKHFVDLETLNNTQISRLAELAVADKERRVAILPCEATPAGVVEDTLTIKLYAKLLRARMEGKKDGV